LQTHPYLSLSSLQVYSSEVNNTDMEVFNGSETVANVAEALANYFQEIEDVLKVCFVCIQFRSLKFHDDAC
jgi:hypothetical protein